MKEQLISFETAKLAKEKGFNEYCYNCYNGNGYLNTAEDNHFELFFNGDLYTVAPTQSLLQKWLRDQKVLVEVSPIDGWDSWSYNITMEDAISPFFIAHQCNEEYETYEHALEEGLKKALDLM
jgi:hypothetical protein